MAHMACLTPDPPPSPCHLQLLDLDQPPAGVGQYRAVVPLPLALRPCLASGCWGRAQSVP